MPDGLNPEMLLRLLMNVLGGGAPGGAQRSPFPSYLNLANVGQIQSGFLSGLLGNFFPAFKTQAPPTMLLSHFDEMQRRGALRSRTQDFYMGYSPTAIKAMTTLGFDKSTFITPQGVPTQLGRILSRGWNSVMGPLMGDPQAFKAQTANTMRDLYSGVFFGRGGGQSGFGLTESEIGRQVSALHNLSFKDNFGLFKRGPFNARGMFDIQRLGVERGMMIAGDLTKRTENLAEVIKTGMAVFHTLDKEKVLENLQRMTQGTVALTNTSQLTGMMHKVAALAKAANLSIETMQRVATEGAALFKQVGITGTAGATMHAQTAMFTNLATSQVGGMAPLVGPQAVARAGGLGITRAILQRQNIGFMGSPFFQKGAFFATQGLPGGLSTQMRQKMLAGQLTPHDLSRGLNALTKQMGRQMFGGGQLTNRQKMFARIAARARMETRQGQAATQFLEDAQERGGTFEILEMQQKAQFTTYLRGMPESVKPLMKSNDPRLRSAQEDILTQRVQEENSQYSAAQARVVAQQMLGMVKMPASQRKAYMTQFQNRQLEAVAAEAQERTRVFSSIAERVFNTITTKGKGTSLRDVFRAAFIGNTKIEKLIRGRTAISGGNVRAALQDFDLGKYFIGQASFGASGFQGKAVQAILTDIAGGSGFTAEEALGAGGEGGFFGTVNQALKESKQIANQKILDKFQKAGALGITTFDAAKEDFAEFFQNKDINLKTIQKFLTDKMGMGRHEAEKFATTSSNLSSVLALARKARPEKFKTFRRSVITLRHRDALRKKVAKGARKISDEDMDIITQATNPVLSKWVTDEEIETINKKYNIGLARGDEFEENAPHILHAMNAERKKVEQQNIEDSKEKITADAKLIYDQAVNYLNQGLRPLSEKEAQQLGVSIKRKALERLSDLTKKHQGDVAAAFTELQHEKAKKENRVFDESRVSTKGMAMMIAEARRRRIGEFAGKDFGKLRLGKREIDELIKLEQEKANTNLFDIKGLLQMILNLLQKFASGGSKGVTPDKPSGPDISIEGVDWFAEALKTQ